MNKYLALTLIVLGLAGCSNQAQRMAECEAQGVSRDACYVAEQNRKASINAAAEKQALENAAQLAQAAKTVKPFTKHIDGIEIKRDRLGIVSIDGKPAALDETNAEASTYSAGIYQVIIYQKGKVAVMESGQFKGYAK